MRVLITGGTGFIGKACTKFLIGKGHEVILYTRDKQNHLGSIRAIENFSEIDKSEAIDVIINLAGAPIDKRWSKTYKTELVISRLQVTSNIVSLIKRLDNKPELLISASAVGFYGPQQDNEIVEGSPYMDGFTHELCKRWEDEAIKAEELGVRVCIPRIGPVLGKSGGIIRKLLPMFKKGFGAKFGTGKQYMSWIHLFDLINIFYFFIENKNCKGVYNATAPTPVTNEEFTKEINTDIHLPTILRIPSIAIKIIYGEMGDNLISNGQRAIPKRLMAEGFKYTYPTMDKAVKKILDKESKKQ